MRFSRLICLLFLIAFVFAADPPLMAQGVSEAAVPAAVDNTPIPLVVAGIATVLALIIGLKLNAFLALIIAAVVVSLLVGWQNEADLGGRMEAVVAAFGTSAGNVGIAIAMAAIIGKCMLDSGSADRIVRSAIGLTGEKKVPLGLTISGFVLAVPVFFDTVFYLLVPLARSLYRRTNQNYLRYLMAIATGGCITHTLVPPTPGPLLVSATLGVDVGMMMLIGGLVAMPAAAIGLMFSYFVDHRMPIAMRSLGKGEDKHKPLLEDQLPSLWVSLLPVLLPVVLIGAGTLATTVADNEDRARLTVADVNDFQVLTQTIASATPSSPFSRVLQSERLTAEQIERLRSDAVTDPQRQAVVDALNEAFLDPKLYAESAFLGVTLSKVSKSGLASNQLKMKPVDRRRMNRALIQDAYPDLFTPQQWDSPARRLSDRLGLYSNANFALMLAALCAMSTLKSIRGLSWRELAGDVEDSLMSGGVIILITAAGGAFGTMLTDTKVSDSIRGLFDGAGASGITLLLLGWAIAAVLKVAQGSSTVAMIIASAMMAAIIGNSKPDYHLVYVATAVGSGSLMGSWMNDSGFWIFAKMGGLTEAESLRSWTPLLATLSISALLVTILLSQVLPLIG